MDSQESYRYRLNHSIESLSNPFKRSIQNALVPHPFDLEKYVPKNLENAREISKRELKGDYLRNKLVLFNENLNEENALLKAMKEESSKFSRQYQLVASKNQNSNGVSNYENSLLEMYRVRGYDEKDIVLKENIFNSSLLLQPDYTYDYLCSMGNKKDIKDDVSLMQDFHNYIKEQSKNHFSPGKGNKFIRQGKKITKQSTSPLDQLEILDSISLKTIKDLNNDLIKEITDSQNSINNIEGEIMVNSPNLLRNNTKKEKKKEQVIVGGPFLSSKGMIRSAKEREYNNGNSEGKKVNESENKKNNEGSSANIYEKPAMTGAEREKRRLHVLTNLYNNIGKNSFLKESNHVKDYIKKYTNKKVEGVKPERGSNLHGFVLDFQKKIEKGDVPELLRILENKRIGPHAVNQQKIDAMK